MVNPSDIVGNSEEEKEEALVTGRQLTGYKSQFLSRWVCHFCNNAARVFVTHTTVFMSQGLGKVKTVLIVW